MKSGMSTLRIGIAGAGLMGRWHAHAAGRAGGRVIAIADPILDSCERLARGHNARALPNVERMLSEIKLDVLHVCSPLETHERIAKAAIDAGVHLMIEKPLSQGAEESELILSRASRSNLLVCPVHQFLFQDGVLKAQVALQSIGRLTHLRGVFFSAGVPGLQSAAVAHDILPHPLSLIQKFLPEGVSRAQWQVMSTTPGEFQAMGMTESVGLSIDISMNSRPTVCAFQLYGSHGTIHLNLFHGYAVIESGHVSRTRKVFHPFDLSLRTLGSAALNLGKRAFRWEPAYPGLQRLVAAFYRAVQTGSESPISSGDAIAVARAYDHLCSLCDLKKQGQPILDGREPPIEFEIGAP